MFEEVSLTRRRFLSSLAMTIAATPFRAIASAKSQSELSSLDRATTWLNSPPLTDAALQGKVVLVEFWTYSCINWRRQLPYVRTWSERYKNQGLVVIGVHSPEFSFEKNIDNIRWAVKDMRVTYPVAVDNDHEIWRGFNNNAWPALYLLDARGSVRHTQFGEGEYEQSERVIQKLLTDRGGGGWKGLASVEPTGFEAAADWSDLRSAENYLGYGRTENFASGGVAHDKSRVYSAPKKVDLNSWAIAGDWTVGKEAIVLNQPGGRLVYRFHARDLHLVMGSGGYRIPVRFRVLLDGHPPGDAHGMDVDEQGNGTVTEPRMYQLIRQSRPISDRQVEIQFLDAGVEAFSVTFG